jgi:peptidoglycan/LPS O-acetylase OafA/YrhL
LPKKDHIPGLDGLRGIACLLIFTGHFLVENRQSVSAFVVRAFSQYWSGVDLFFVLSGFVIFLSLNRLKERAPAIPRLFRLYFTSRTFRILPVYSVFLAVYFCLPRLYPQLAHDQLFMSSIPNRVYLYFAQSWYMAFQHRAGAGFVDASWSLCAEVFLYVLSFIIVCLASRRHQIKAMMAVVAASYCARLYVVFLTHNFLAAYLLPVCRMDGFMIGGIVAFLYSSDRLQEIPAQPLNRVLLTLFGVFAVLSICAWHFASSFSILFAYTFYAFFYAAILVAIVNGDFPALSKGPLKYIGTISYFIYLFHFPIVYWMKRLSETLQWNVFINFTATLAVTIGAATLSWHLMERPLIDLGKSLNRLGARD